MTDQHDENKLIAERRAKLDELRTHEGPTFPNQFQPAHSADELQKVCFHHVDLSCVP